MAASFNQIYRLECGDCLGIYIGKTSRKMISRVSEHLSAQFFSSFEKSASGDHLLISGHRYREVSAGCIIQKQNRFLPNHFESHNQMKTYQRSQKIKIRFHVFRVLRQVIKEFPNVTSPGIGEYTSESWIYRWGPELEIFQVPGM